MCKSATPITAAINLLPRTLQNANRSVGGFTIVELIAILIIMGILAAFAMPRFFNRGTFEGRSFYDQTVAMVQYAQKVAIAQNRNVYVRLNGVSVALCFDATCTSQVVAPSGSNSGSTATIAACGSTTWFCEAVPTGVTYSASVSTYISANPTFFFSSLGKPYNTADVIPNSTFIRPLTISITDGNTPHAFTIEQETGYVHP